MEYCWTLFNNSNVRGHNGNCHAWGEDHWTLPLQTYPPPPSAAPDSTVGAFHAPNPHFFKPDPHLTCLKLGKRQYFEDATPPSPPPGQFCISKKGKPYADAGVGDPRCQVEGCGAVLVNAKDYHRRHKVCEMHAKAPRVVVLGVEQRFCQQCSRCVCVCVFLT